MFCKPYLRLLRTKIHIQMESYFFCPELIVQFFSISSYVFWEPVKLLLCQQLMHSLHCIICSVFLEVHYEDSQLTFQSGLRSICGLLYHWSMNDHELLSVSASGLLFLYASETLPVFTECCWVVNALFHIQDIPDSNRRLSWLRLKWHPSTLSSSLFTNLSFDCIIQAIEWKGC
jgi:hypothetical protein